MEHEGCYVKLADDPAFWLVQDGMRLIVASPEEMYRHGLRPVHCVTAEELEAIPVASVLGPTTVDEE